MSELNNLKINAKKMNAKSRWCNLCKLNTQETEQCWFNPKNNIAQSNEKPERKPHHKNQNFQ